MNKKKKRIAGPRRATTWAACCAASRRTTSSAARFCASPGMKTHTKFEGEVYVLKKEEGGRHKPFFSNYRPQFYMRTTDVTGTIELAGRRQDGHAGRQREDGRRS